MCLEAISRFTNSRLGVIVVDNGSADEPVKVTSRYSNVRLVRLPRNVGHGTAADIGFLLARTEYLVSLDVDAFPISSGWLERLIGPLSRGCSVSGAHVRGGFVHPCCLAIRFVDFVSHRHTFTPRYGSTRILAQSSDDTLATGWDVGQRISLLESNRYLIERTYVSGPGDMGSEWEGLIYHNSYSTRFGSKVAPPPEEYELGVSFSAAYTAWKEAVKRHLGSEKLY